MEKRTFKNLSALAIRFLKKLGGFYPVLRDR
jgi:hypothetical protein